jgi:hypothetical protein
MSNKSRWTREEELNLIKDISLGTTLDSLAIKHNRSVSAMELRLKKIIYENASEGKSLESISKLLNIPEDKVRQYFYSYKEFREKHTGLVDDVIPVINNQSKSNDIHQSKSEQTGGSKGGSDEKMNKIKSKLRKMEEENRIIKLIVENKELTHKLNKLIKEGKLDESVKKLIKILRKTKK